MLGSLLALALGAVPPASDADLLEKARLFRSALIERHLSPEGVVLYRVNLSTLADDLASGRYPNLADAPTFTGIWAVTSCTRAAVEPEGPGRAEALRDAASALDGLEFLTRVTGQPGLLARSVRRGDVQPDEAQQKWFPAPAALEGWRWRGDVSHDQYANGLLPAIAACRAAFPERARRLAVEFAGYLIDGGFELRDPDGERTRFGALGPFAGLGWNSIALLTSYAGLSLAAALDPDPRWRAQADRLRDRFRVTARARITNLRIARVTNRSNDLMAWGLYAALVPLARETADPALVDLRHGMHRTWLRSRSDENPYFAALFCLAEPSGCDRAALERGRQTLARFPLEKRRLAAPPALSAVPLRWIPERKGAPAARGLVPIELRPVSSFEWKSSPYRVRSIPAPDVEYSGLDYLAAFWTLRAAEATR
jgi:hypothetical protein